eukprot:TRINITY_DN17166_c0_g1_i1.p1 TRINITY_DN17166_c0_g1~~TRINITY_DN17166_c0_g1_i1.p1  ORF type:complete len:289 (+),score=44.38 TRINITY_DN17166_c0_g1_i1:113-979(+)
MAKKKDKDKKGTKETVISWMGVFAGCLVICCCAPQISYRWNGPWQGFHLRFAIPRRYALWGASNKYGQLVSWMKLQSHTCKLQKEHAQGSGLLSVAAMGANMLLKDSPAAGATSVLGCSFWDSCKEAVITRCGQYKIMMIVGFVAIAFNIIAGLILFCTPMFVNSEYNAEGKGKKKEKRKGEARLFLFQMMVTSFILNFISWAMIMLSSANMLDTLKMKQAIPFAQPSVGSFIHIGAIAIHLPCVIVAWYKWAYGGKKKKEEGEEDDEDDNAEAAPAVPMPDSGPPGM